MSAKRWIVLEPPADGRSGKDADTRFVKDAFAPLAFLFLFFWLFWHRLWLAGIAVLALDIALMLIGWWEGFALVSSIGQTLMAILLGLEGRNILVSKRLKQGWRMVSVVHADRREDAELRYFHDEQDGASGVTAPDRSYDLPWSARTA